MLLVHSPGGATHSASIGNGQAENCQNRLFWFRLLFSRQKQAKMTGENDDSSYPKMEEPQVYVERTLAIIKPDALHKSEEIEDIILRSGFSILQVSQKK